MSSILVIYFIARGEGCQCGGQLRWELFFPTLQLIIFGIQSEMLSSQWSILICSDKNAMAAFETALGEKKEKKKRNAVIRFAGFGSSEDSSTLGKASALFLKMFANHTR